MDKNRNIEYTFDKFRSYGEMYFVVQQTHEANEYELIVCIDRHLSVNQRFERLFDSY